MNFINYYFLIILKFNDIKNVYFTVNLFNPFSYLIILIYNNHLHRF